MEVCKMKSGIKGLGILVIGVSLLFIIVSLYFVSPVGMTVYACSGRMRPLAFALLKLKRIDPNRQDQKSIWLNTPMQMVLYELADPSDFQWRERVADWFLSRGGDLNHRDKVTGLTIVHEAVLEQNEPFLRWLLSKGVDPNMKVTQGAGFKMAGQTPLAFAHFILRKDKLDPSRKEKLRTIIEILKAAKAHE